MRFAPSRRGRETEARAGHALFQRPRGEGQQSRPSQGDGPAPGGDPPPESGGGVRGGDGLALAPGDHPRAAPMGSAVVPKPCGPLSLGDDGPGDNEGDTKSSDEGPGRTHRPHQRSNGEELRQTLTTPTDARRPGGAAMALGGPRSLAGASPTGPGHPGLAELHGGFPVISPQATRLKDRKRNRLEDKGEF